jgi:hypothetical protein
LNLAVIANPSTTSIEDLNIYGRSGWPGPDCRKVSLGAPNHVRDLAVRERLGRAGDERCHTEPFRRRHMKALGVGASLSRAWLAGLVFETVGFTTRGTRPRRCC